MGPRGVLLVNPNDLGYLVGIPPSGSSIDFLILYVDDILIIGNDVELLNSVKGCLNKSFSMKDLGEASYILGIKIYRDR